MAGPRVHHVSTYTFGGAAVAARRLHDGLVRLGVPSHFLHGSEARNRVDDPAFAPLPTTVPVPRWMEAAWRRWDRMRRREARRDWRRHLEKRPSGYEVFSAARLFEPTWLDAKAIRPEVLHLHWVAFLIDHPTFFASLPQQVPIFWTLHDLNPFTGGCHYASGCERFRSGCGHCPQLADPGPSDASRHSFDVKRRAFRGHRLHIVTPSRWLGDLARTSPIWPEETQFHVIPYGLDIEIYQPRQASGIRQEYGIGEHAFTFVFGAEDIANRRKGMPHLSAALARIERQENWHAIVFGDGQIPSLPSWLNVHRAGYVSDEDRKVALLSAGDLFVMPSLEDNQPQTGLEASACGLPVLAFESGGVPEYVRDAKTGYLARVGDANDLARQLVNASTHPETRIAMGQAARRMIETEFALQLQAQRMTRLYIQAREATRWRPRSAA